MMNNSRAFSATILASIIEEGKSLSEVAFPDSLAQALCYGCCRFYFQLDYIANELITKPLKAKDADIKALILVGLYQLLYMRIKPHAAVSETVDACISLKKPWAKSFINALLRRFLREESQWKKALLEKEISRFSHPSWFITAIKKAYPENYESILKANNEQAPLTLRVNLTKITREAYLEKLQEKNIEADIHPCIRSAIVLRSPVPVNDLPLFFEGFCQVQDAAAQVAAELLNPSPNEYILDACAAPGGKTTHLLEAAHPLSVLAIDIEPTRCNKIIENLNRLQLQAIVKCADINNLNSWWDGKPFDKILLDAPCSATGVIRRHPDIKLLRRETDIKALQKVQLAILKTLWPLLKVNGSLLYATCSVLPSENTDVISEFLSKENSAREITINKPFGIANQHGLQILPAEHNMDGFYYCLLTKTS